MDPRAGQLDDTNNEALYATEVDQMTEVDETETTSTDSDDPEAIRQNIEQTRSHMSETIDAIQERLAPERLVADMRETVKTATVKKVQDMTDTVRDSAMGAGATFTETVRQNPIPALMAGVGLGWLVFRAMRAPAKQQRPQGVRYIPIDAAQPRAGYTYLGTYPTTAPGMQPSGSAPADQPGITDRAGQAVSQAKDRVSDLAGTVQDRAGDLGDQVQQQAGQARDWLQEAWQQQPLVFSAAALAIGAAVGVILPESQPEQRLMGDMRDSLMENVQEATQETAQKVQQVAKRAMDTAQDEAQKQGLAGSRAIPLASSYGDESAVAVATPYLLLTAFYLW